jgi:hypothetical protein
MLLEQFPKSDHLKDAFILCAHSTAMSHQGPLYDGQALTRSRELRQSAVRLFADEVDRERILDEIRRIDEEKARSEWANVEFWQTKRDPVAAAACAREVIRLYPNSTYAARARELLAEVSNEQQPAAETQPADAERSWLPWLRGRSNDGPDYEEPREPAPGLFPAGGSPGRASL